MKTIRFSKFFIPAAVISVIIIIFSIVGFFKLGFNLGVDFQAGLIQEVRFAPTAFSIRWNGTTNAILFHNNSGVQIVISGSGIESRTYTFAYNNYTTIESLSAAMMEQVEGLEISISADPDTDTQRLLFSTQSNPALSSETSFIVHYNPLQAEEIPISEIREAFADLGQTVSVQRMGAPQDRHFMIRVEDKEITATADDNEDIVFEVDEEGNVITPDNGDVTTEDSEDAGTGTAMIAVEIIKMLETYFENDPFVVLRSDYVGSRFSKDLTDQAGFLVLLTLVLILVYVTIRFKPRYAISAVIAIVHDVIIIIAFVVWTRMEFTTSTIAAFLTILGYSINNTIIVFDRIRENLRIYPDDPFIDVLNRSLSGVLGRTVITTLTTMLAVGSLYVFTTGAMKDFALALIVGMASGVYTTLFIASGLVYFFEKRSKAKKA